MATTSNIAAHEWLFHFGIVADLLVAVVLIFLTLALYGLFGGVDRNLAIQVVIFGGVMSTLIYFVGVVSDSEARIFVHGADYLSVFDKPQLDALAMLFLQLRDRQNIAAEILWGVGLFPLGVSCPAIPRHLAWHQRIGVRRPQLHRHTVATLPSASCAPTPSPPCWAKWLSCSGS